MQPTRYEAARFGAFGAGPKRPLGSWTMSGAKRDVEEEDDAAAAEEENEEEAGDDAVIEEADENISTDTPLP